MGASTSTDATASRRFGRFDPERNGKTLGAYVAHFAPIVDADAGAAPAAASQLISVHKGGIDGYVLQTGDRRFRRVPEYPISCCAFAAQSAFGPVVITGDASGGILVYDAAWLKPIAVLSDGAGAGLGKPPITAMALGERGTILVGNESGATDVIEVDTGSKLCTFRTPQFEEHVEDFDGSSRGSSSAPGHGSVVSLALCGAPSSPVLAVGFSNAIVHLFDLRRGDWLRDLRTVARRSANILDMIALPSAVVGPRRAAAASGAAGGAGATMAGSMVGGLLLAFDKHPTKVWVHALRGGAPPVLDFSRELVAVDMAER